MRREDADDARVLDFQLFVIDVLSFENFTWRVGHGNIDLLE